MDCNHEIFLLRNLDNNRGGSTNSSTEGGGGGSGAGILQGGFRVQVRGNFHILTSKKYTGGGG